MIRIYIFLLLALAGMANATESRLKPTGWAIGGIAFAVASKQLLNIALSVNTLCDNSESAKFYWIGTGFCMLGATICMGKTVYYLKSKRV